MATLSLIAYIVTKVCLVSPGTRPQASMARYMPDCPVATPLSCLDVSRANIYLKQVRSRSDTALFT
ncbi:MAG: hypothetical protein IPM86_01955 [Saprospiraceae bacterium]|nr:hypothetical protein [Saprospiraceae bacterium]